MRRREPTDRELVERYQRGDTAAAAELIARHQDHVRAYCFTALDDPDEAEDAVQATFEAVMRRLPTFDGGERIERYMIVTARGRCLSAKRRRSHPAHQPAALNEGHAVVDDVHGTVDDRINLQIILGNLTPRHAELLTERLIDGEPLDVMARRRDTSSGSVAVMVHRAVTAARLVATNRDMWSLLPALVAARLARGLGRRDSAGVSVAALPATALAVAGVLALGVTPASTTPASANEMADRVATSSTAYLEPEPTHPHRHAPQERTNPVVEAPVPTTTMPDGPDSGTVTALAPIPETAIPGTDRSINQDFPEQADHRYAVEAGDVEVVAFDSTDEPAQEPVHQNACPTVTTIPLVTCKSND